MKIRILSIALSLFFLSTSINLAAQTNGQLYTLGVQMGLASFQASVVMGASNNSDDVEMAYQLIRPGLIDAYKLVNSINLKHPQLLSIDGLNNVIKHYGDGGLDRGDDFKKNKPYLTRYYNNIISIRDGFTAQLAKQSGMSNLAHAYVMGINIAIAEGQATAGEAARQIVYASLVNAKVDAQALNLDLTPLNECISLINATTPIAEIYTRIVSMRSTYQSSL